MAAITNYLVLLFLVSVATVTGGQMLDGFPFDADPEEAYAGTGILDQINSTEAEELERRVREWLDVKISSQPPGLVFRTSQSSSDGPGFVGSETFIPESSGQKSSNLLFNYQPNNKTLVQLSFTKPIDKSMSLGKVKKMFRFVAIDRIPLTNFDYPGNWDITPQTSMSSFSEGVTIKKFSGDRIGVKIFTEAFAIHGSRNDINYIADIGAPKGTYFQVREKLPMELEFDVPIQLVDE